MSKMQTRDAVGTGEHGAHFRYPCVLMCNVRLESERFLQSPDVCFGSQGAGAASLREFILQSVSSLPLNTLQPVDTASGDRHSEVSASKQ